MEDPDGNKGVTLSRDIVKVAAVALQKNLQLLGPHVLPYTEQLKYPTPPPPFPPLTPFQSLPPSVRVCKASLE